MNDRIVEARLLQIEKKQKNDMPHYECPFNFSGTMFIILANFFNIILKSSMLFSYMFKVVLGIISLVMWVYIWLS